jgi:hypothetical protein
MRLRCSKGRVSIPDDGDPPPPSTPAADRATAAIVP